MSRASSSQKRRDRDQFSDVLRSLVAYVRRTDRRLYSTAVVRIVNRLTREYRHARVPPLPPACAIVVVFVFCSREISLPGVTMSRNGKLIIPGRRSTMQTRVPIIARFEKTRRAPWTPLSFVSWIFAPVSFYAEKSARARRSSRSGNFSRGFRVIMQEGGSPEVRAPRAISQRGRHGGTAY